MFRIEFGVRNRCIASILNLKSMHRIDLNIKIDAMHRFWTSNSMRFDVFEVFFDHFDDFGASKSSKSSNLKFKIDASHQFWTWNRCIASILTSKSMRCIDFELQIRFDVFHRKHRSNQSIRSISSINWCRSHQFIDEIEFEWKSMSHRFSN